MSRNLFQQVLDEETELEGSLRSMPVHSTSERRIEMDDIVPMIEKISSLKDQITELKHATKDELADLRRTVQGLEGAMGAMRLETERVRSASGASISESRIRALISDCESHPDAEVCKRRMTEAEQAVATVLARRAEAEDEEAEPAQREHESALSYLRCEECGPKFIEASAKVPEFRAELLEKYGDRDVDALIRVLSAQGYAVEKKEAKERDWLTGV